MVILTFWLIYTCLSWLKHVVNWKYLSANQKLRILWHLEVDILYRVQQCPTCVFSCWKSGACISLCFVFRNQACIFWNCHFYLFKTPKHIWVMKTRKGAKRQEPKENSENCTTSSNTVSDTTDASHVSASSTDDLRNAALLERIESVVECAVAKVMEKERVKFKEYMEEREKKFKEILDEKLASLHKLEVSLDKKNQRYSRSQTNSGDHCRKCWSTDATHRPSWTVFAAEQHQGPGS